MGQYRLTAKADRDIEALYEYGIVHFGLRQAQTYILGLHEHFDMLVENPKFGRDASLIAINLRRFEYQPHVIFYMQEEMDILIVRVLRKEMDFKRHF